MQFLNILFLFEETWRHQQQINFAIPKYFVLVWRNLKTPAAATNYIRTTDDLCIVHWSRPPVSQHSTLSHYQSETEILNICTFCRKLFANRDNYHLYRLQKNCPSTKTTNICTVQWSINLNFIQNFKIAKKCIHDMLMLLTHV